MIEHPSNEPRDNPYQSPRLETTENHQASMARPVARGFSPHRIAWVTAALSLGMAPAHFFVSCQASGSICLSSMLLSALTVGLSVAERIETRTAKPFALASVGLFAHLLFTH